MKKAKQLEFKKVGGWGGKRKNAGRPNLSKTVNHMKRARVDFRQPLHLTQRLKKGIPSLRRKEFLHLFRRSLNKAKKFGLHVIHYSLLGNHIHMIVETRDNQALGRGMRSLGGSFAKAIQSKAGLTGGIFSGRYHLKAITNPSQMRRTLEYVLLNMCKHQDFLEHMDPYSSARFFPHWRKLLGARMNDVIEWELETLSTALKEAGLSPPRSWLATQGWMRSSA
jgi:REP element-mobilizing transposase RayT